MNFGEGTYSMKPETEKLLHQCRVMLLHYSNEQLNTLFMSWFERMVGEESIDEVLDDLCLLLGYGVRSAHSHILYATYTAWWEVEGSADLDGEFECVDVAALQHHLITMPIKQFAFVTELAYHVCVLDAEVVGQPCPPTGQEWLRALAFWLDNGARERFHSTSSHANSARLSSASSRISWSSRHGNVAICCWVRMSAIKCWCSSRAGAKKSSPVYQRAADGSAVCQHPY